MRLWDEMTLPTRGEKGELLTGAWERSYSPCLRRCPKCGYSMVTNRKGTFACNRCTYRDEQDVSNLAPLGGDWGRPRRVYRACSHNQHLFGTGD